jgi:hypothetical protein
MRSQRRKVPIVAGLLIGAVIAFPTMFPLPVCAQGQTDKPQGAAQAPTEGVLRPDVAGFLERMGRTLEASQFSFRARTIRAYAGPNGELLHIMHTIKTIVRRPDRLAVDVTGDDGSTRLLYDGKAVALLGHDQKQYAHMPASGGISSIMDMLTDKLRLEFPLADLIADSPNDSLLADIVSGDQVGTATIDGTPCRHFFFSQLPDLDLELWLEDNERALPRRIYITYRTLPGRPNFVAELSDWNFSIQPGDTEFVFAPAAGMTKVELKPRASATPAPSK